MNTFYFEKIDQDTRCIEFTVNPALRFSDKILRSTILIPFLPSYLNRDLLSYLYSLKSGDKVDWVKPYNCGDIFGCQYYTGEVDFPQLQKAINRFLKTNSEAKSYVGHEFSLTYKEHEQPGFDPRLIYRELLKQPEWKKRRFEILIRDRHRCQDCGVYGNFCIRDHGLILSCYTFEDMDNERLLTLNTAFSVTNSYQLPFISLYGRLDDKSVHQDLFGKTVLQVHHKYYVLNATPWDHPDESMVTLCRECHEKAHTPKVPMPVMVRKEGELVPDPNLHVTDCGKCDGQGYIEEYKHYKGGVCFECYGKGYVFALKDKSTFLN